MTKAGPDQAMAKGVMALAAGAPPGFPKARPPRPAGRDGQSVPRLFFTTPAGWAGGLHQEEALHAEPRRKREMNR